MRYQECRCCGYVQLETEFLPSQEEEKARYLLHRNSPEDSGYIQFIMEFMHVATPYLKPGSEVLDFGSGPEPVPAQLLSRMGFPVTLYDPMFAPDENWRRRTWDAILVHEVAEHLVHPGVVFEELAASLAPGGVLCIRTRFLPDDHAMFITWHYRTDPTHVGFFCARSISELASRLGLSPLLIEGPDRAILAKQPGGV